MRRWGRQLAGAALISLVLAPAAQARTECASPPEGGPGYQLQRVHADSLTLPATTPPIAILDSGVGPVPQLGSRVGRGANLVEPRQATTDSSGHGTAVATVAAGDEGPAQGVAPIAPLIPVTILGRDGDASTSRVVKGIARAVALGARVINLSLAAPQRTARPADDRTLQNAIFAAVSRGVVVVAPSGNEGRSALDVPAAYAHVIAVGATDPTGTRASFSNAGTGLDLVAPGSAITTAAPSAVCSSGFQIVSGTSFAAPAVSGAAALLLSAHPELDVSQVAAILRSSAAAAASGWTSSLGFGMLDVASALATPVPGKADPEVNDTPEWAARRSAVLVAPKRVAAVHGALTPRADPRDVFRVRLRRGDRLRMKVDPVGPGALQLSFGRAKLAPARGLSMTERVDKPGDYYVAVGIRRLPPAGAGYTLSLKR